MRKSILFFILCGSFLACKKPENRACFKSWGEETSRTVALGNFSKLHLKEHMAFVLVQDSTNKLVINAGKNMVNLIETSVDDDGFLTIESKNKCRFLRNKKKVIQVEIHFTNIDEINYSGTETMTNLGTLVFGEFKMVIRDGAGPVNLKLNAQHVDTEISNGFGDYTLSGTSVNARISASSNGYCDVTGLLVSNELFVVSQTSAPMKINASNVIINGYQKSSGNIYYVGIPLGIQVAQTGTGKILPL